MSPTFLVDTNILVYSVDPRDPVKQSACSQLLGYLSGRQQGVVSAQCLTEYGRALRRSPRHLDAQRAAQDVTAFAEVFAVLPLTLQAIQDGLRIQALHQLAYWDSFIWAVASLNNVPYILTEDGQDGRSIEGVTYLNPLVSGFVLPPAG